jgi:hypothetical protein
VSRIVARSRQLSTDVVLTPCAGASSGSSGCAAFVVQAKILIHGLPIDQQILIEEAFSGVQFSDAAVDRIEVVGDLIRHIEITNKASAA